MSKSSTIKDVAVRAGVSLGTVSNHINRTKAIKPATAWRIDQAIAELDFVPNRAVRTLRGNRSHVVGLVVPDATNPFFMELARHVEDVARANDCVVIFCDAAGDTERETNYLRSLAEMRVSGVIVASIDDETKNLRALQSVGAPIVILGLNDPGVGPSTIAVDHRNGGYIAANHLLSIGRRNILFAGGPGGGLVLEHRMEGAKAAIADHPDGGSVTFTRIDSKGRTVGERAALVDALLVLDPRPDAILAGNDMIALTLINGLLRRGVRVPEDIAIVGHDDVEAASQALIPLTTVRQPIAELGRLAGAILFRQAAEQHPVREHFELTLELVVRDSTVAPRGKEWNALISHAPR
jgi:LacI family transcriptional regulator